MLVGGSLPLIKVFSTLPFPFLKLFCLHVSVRTSLLARGSRGPHPPGYRRISPQFLLNLQPSICTSVMRVFVGIRCHTSIHRHQTFTVCFPVRLICTSIHHVTRLFMLSRLDSSALSPPPNIFFVFSHWFSLLKNVGKYWWYAGFVPGS